MARTVNVPAVANRWVTLNGSRLDSTTSGSDPSPQSTVSDKTSVESASQRTPVNVAVSPARILFVSFRSFASGGLLNDGPLSSVIDSGEAKLMATGGLLNERVTDVAVTV